MKKLLSAEQSAILIAKGISANKASERTPDWNDINNTGKPLERRELLPIFTLADICALLPKEIERDTINCGLDIYYSPIGSYFWRASYLTYSYSEIQYVAVEKNEEELIDALYSLLCWVIDKGYIDLTK